MINRAVVVLLLSLGSNLINFNDSINRLLIESQLVLATGDHNSSNKDTSLSKDNEAIEDTKNASLSKDDEAIQDTNMDEDSGSDADTDEFLDEGIENELNGLYQQEQTEDIKNQIRTLERLLKGDLPLKGEIIIGDRVLPPIPPQD
jgi:hypothetical protein